MKKILLKRKNLNNPQIKAYEKAVRQGERSYHVVKTNSGWALKKGNSNKITKLFTTQKQAIEFGTKKAKTIKSNFFVHGRDGLIKQRSYFSD